MSQQIYVSTDERNRAITARCKALREGAIDPDVPRHNCREKRERIALGIELLMLHAKPGVGLTRDDMAPWLGCTAAAIYEMEKKALKKAAVLVRFGRHRHMRRELLSA